MRVYEIAKEVGIPNKDLIAKIRALGLEVNNHMSSLDADDVARIKRSLEKEKQLVAQPQQTQRLSTGGSGTTVLRRRSSGDKASETADERSVEREPVRARAPEPVRPAAPAAPPVIRRRTVAEEAPAPAAAPAPSPSRAPAESGTLGTAATPVAQPRETGAAPVSMRDQAGSA